YIAGQSWSEMMRILIHQEANMALYYVLLHLWLGIGGDSEFSVRLLSVIFAVAIVPTMYLLARRLFGQRTGLIAGLLVAINPFWLQYAQEARSYSLVILLVPLSTLFFVRAIEKPTASRFAIWVIVNALAVYAHIFAGFVVVGQVISLVWLRNERLPLRSLAIS